MKRFLTICLLILAVLLHAVAGHGGGSEEDRRLSKIGRTLGVDLSMGTLVRYEDDHGGYHGDGLTAAEIGLDGSIEGLAGAPGWKPLPLSENAAQALSMCLGLSGAVVTAAEEGHYYFYDRHSESNDPYDDTELCSRPSWNFTMAVYDSCRGQLYFCELDT